MRVQTLRWLSGVTALLLAASLGQAAVLAGRLQVTVGSASWMALFAAWSAVLLLALVVTWVSFRPTGPRLTSRLARILERLPLTAPAAVISVIVFSVLLPALVLVRLPDPLGLLLRLISLRAVVFWFVVLAGAICLRVRQPDAPLGRQLALIALVYGVVFRAAAFLPDVSTNPFSLGWSEASRYYYASLFLAQKVYSVAAHPSVLHPTRYLMQAVPFLFDGLPLWFHRAWQVLLWLVTNALAAWLLARRLRVQAGDRTPLLAAWAFLFLFQAPVWYHLVVMVILLLWGVDTGHFWRTLLVVGAASIWAGMSRVNWIPFPAALAALVYLLEIPRDGKPFLHYLAPPFLWGLVGTALGLASQAAYVLLSGNALEQFGSSFTSDLLWYRLFPSATYPLGVIPGVLLVSAPVLWAASQRLGFGWQGLEPLRRLAILGLFLIFLGGGLVVSAKIGGGSNLHNMDGYITLLMVFGAYVVFGLERLGESVRSHVLALAIVVPLGFALATAAPFERADADEVQADLAELYRLVEESTAQGGQILFIAERHLLAFDPKPGAELVEDYEKVFLMEMAMADNAAYLGRFEQDLAANRFALIITDIVNFNPQTSANEFGEENNAWDHAVSYPLLCYYQEVQTLETARVEILAPKALPDCPSIR